MDEKGIWQLMCNFTLYSDVNIFVSLAVARTPPLPPPPYSLFLWLFGCLLPLWRDGASADVDVGPVILVLVAAHVGPHIHGVLAVSLPQLGASVRLWLARHWRVVQVLLVWLCAFIFPGSLSAMMLRQVQTAAAAAPSVGLGLFVGVSLNVHARVTRLSVGRVPAALGL